MPSRLTGLLADPKLKADVANRLAAGNLPLRLRYKPEQVRDFLLNLQPDSEIPPAQRELEAIVLLVGRPVLQVQHNSYEIPLSDEWHQRLSASRSKIEKAILSVGRIEVENHPGYDWLGTGWLVKDDVIVTNRHVAAEFAKKSGTGFVFRHNFMNKLMKARIDVREESGVPEEIQYKATEVLYIAEDDGFDVAFLKVASASEDGVALPAPITLSSAAPASGTDVAVIGYPAEDSRNNYAEMERIFGSVYDVKRLAPGKVKPSGQAHILYHDCTTLGGNSGSVVLDISTGEAVGLHFAGKYLQGNFAVSAAKVAEILASL